MLVFDSEDCVVDGEECLADQVDSCAADNYHKMGVMVSDSV